MEITAKLSNVRIERVPDSESISGYCYVAHGKIYQDKRSRFSDGSEITTSRVSQFINGIIHTMNSKYEVI